MLTFTATEPTFVIPITTKCPSPFHERSSLRANHLYACIPLFCAPFLAENDLNMKAEKVSSLLQEHNLAMTKKLSLKKNH